MGVELEDVAPVQVLGSGTPLDAAVQKALERAALLFDMTVDEVRNRVAITGSLDIGQSGMVAASLLAPLGKLSKLGILHLIREQYGV